MRAGGADEEKLRCHEQTDKLSHFDPHVSDPN
jgi:hypothetical protein